MFKSRKFMLDSCNFLFSNHGNWIIRSDLARSRVCSISPSISQQTGSAFISGKCCEKGKSDVSLTKIFKGEDLCKKWTNFLFGNGVFLRFVKISISSDFEISKIRLFGSKFSKISIFSSSNLT